MIGDWVSYVGTPIKVKNVYEDCINFQHDIPFVQEEFSIEQTDIKPIPLTPEILEKNGFTIKKNWAQIGNFGDSPLIMWHFEDDVFWRDFKHELEIHQNDTGKVHIRIPCEYVHELQHALRLCGIEKEINL